MSGDAVVGDTDTLVVGGGMFGCATAYYLARFGVDVTVVDAGDVGGEASGANAGNLHLQLSPFTHADKSQAWVTDFARTLPFFAAAMTLWKRLGHELDADFELRCPGGLMVAETDRQLEVLRDKVALERSQGLQVELIGREALRGLAPYLADDVQGASYCTEEGMANALLAVVAFADAARALGARFVTHARVERLELQADGWRVATRRGTIRCRRLVIAAGSSSGVVAAMAGAALPLAHRDIQMVATEPCEPFVEHLVYHAEERLTLKQVASGNVLIGGGWTATRDATFGRPAVLADSLRGSLAVARRVVPRLADVSVIRTWAGPNIYTPDGRPILGAFADVPGLYAAVCNTYGFTLGPLCGMLVAEQVAGRPATFDLSPFSPARFDATAQASSPAAEH